MLRIEAHQCIAPILPRAKQQRSCCVELGQRGNIDAVLGVTFGGSHSTASLCHRGGNEFADKHGTAILVSNAKAGRR